MAESVLRGVINFFEALGIYDVLLPFMLVFTIVFAILERTAVLGKETIGGESYTRKNLNAMVAFVMGLLVVASSKLVESVLMISSQVVLLVLLGVFFLMLVATFYTEKEIEKGGLQEAWARWTFGFVMFLGLVAIFLNSIKTEAGESWWEIFWQWLSGFWDSAAVASIVLIIFIVVFIVWITSSKGGS